MGENAGVVVPEPPRQTGQDGGGGERERGEGDRVKTDLNQQQKEDEGNGGLQVGEQEGVRRGKEEDGVMAGDDKEVKVGVRELGLEGEIQEEVEQEVVQGLVEEEVEVHRREVERVEDGVGGKDDGAMVEEEREDEGRRVRELKAVSRQRKLTL